MAAAEGGRTWLGALPVVALIVLSALLGMALLRRVGWHTLSLTQLRMRQQVSPVPALFEGFMLALAGVLLLLPGLLSDGLALLLLIAPLRRWLLGRLRRMPAAAVYVGEPNRRAVPDVIEGEYRHASPNAADHDVSIR